MRLPVLLLCTGTVRAESGFRDLPVPPAGEAPALCGDAPGFGRAAFRREFHAAAIAFVTAHLGRGP